VNVFTRRSDSQPGRRDFLRAISTVGVSGVSALLGDLALRSGIVLPSAKLAYKAHGIPSLWGHVAGASLNAADSRFIEAEIKALLAS